MKITPTLLQQIYHVVKSAEQSPENFVASLYASYHADDVSKTTLRRIYYEGTPYQLVRSYADLGPHKCLWTLKRDIHEWISDRLYPSTLSALKRTLCDIMWQISSEDYETVVGALADIDGADSKSTATLMARILWYAMYRDCAQASLDRVA